MKKRKPTRVKSKVFNYQVAARQRHTGSSWWIHGMIVLALIAVAGGIAYVWQHNRMLALGDDVVRLRSEIAALDEEQIKLEADLGKFKQPSRIRRELHRRNIHLVPASPGQIVRMKEPEPLVIAEDSEQNQPLGKKLWNALVLGER